MKRIIFLGICILSQLLMLQGQTLNNRRIIKFPTNLEETSGIISLRNGASVWTHNDSGGRPELYEMDTMGNVIRTVVIANATNVDWEDITQDDQGNIYIGDFGNNNGIRTDLTIYKISDPYLTPNDTVIAKMITFSYENQNSFPPQSADNNFDVEAMVVFKDSLFLFTKNQTTPFNGMVRMYMLPTTSGNYSISPVDSFKTGTGAMASYWVTSAALNADAGVFVMISSNYLWKFTNFPDNRFLQGSVTQYALNEFSQKEGVCFVDSTHLYLSDEYNGFSNPAATLYGINLANGANLGVLEEVANGFYTISPNPAANEIRFSNIPRSNVDIRIFESTGKCIFEKNELPAQISLENWTNGIYFVQITDKSGKTYHSKFCVSRP